MTTIKQIRDYETDILSETKNYNNLIILRKCLIDESLDKSIRLASLHSLRRIYIALFDKNIFDIGYNTNESLRNDFNKWLLQQYHGYLIALSDIIKTSDNDIHFLASIRTLVDLISKDYKYTDQPIEFRNIINFSVFTYSLIIDSCLNRDDELSAEVLVAVKEEVFGKPDCYYFALYIVRERINEIKSNNDDTNNFTRNCLDILRMLTLPDEESIQSDNMLVKITIDKSISKVRNDDDSDNETLTTTTNQTNKKRKIKSNSLTSEKKKKSNNSIFQIQDLLDFSVYRMMYSKTWILFLSLHLTIDQHKIILKYLSDFVVNNLENPMLLSDYFIQSFEYGLSNQLTVANNSSSNTINRKLISILSLENLFNLIVNYNLDYKNYFISLYQLCNIDIFICKYNHKFIKLLSQSLKSSNLSLNIITSFMKRLSRLILSIHCPMIYYCIYQIIYLLRKHSLSHILIHNPDNKQIDKYNPFEETNFDLCNSTTSSLWELDICKGHYYYEIADLISNIQSNKQLTILDKQSSYIDINEYINVKKYNYNSFIDKEHKNIKSNSELTYIEPNRYIKKASVVDKCFNFK